MRRASSWLIALLAIAVFVAAGYVVTKKDPVPQAGTVLPVPSAVALPTAVPSSGGSTRTAGAAVVAFLGDGWTAGDGASTPAGAFPALVAARLGVSGRAFGASGTGYAKTGRDAGAYATRVAGVVAAHPDVVVVSGGRTDTSDYLPTLRSRATALFADLHRDLPGAVLVALPPWWGDSDAPATLGPIASAVRSAVTAAGGRYLDIPDPLHGHPADMASAANPNDAGHRAIADAVATALSGVVSGVLSRR